MTRWMLVAALLLSPAMAAGEPARLEGDCLPTLLGATPDSPEAAAFVAAMGPGYTNRHAEDVEIWEWRASGLEVQAWYRSDTRRFVYLSIRVGHDQDPGQWPVALPFGLTAEDSPASAQKKVATAARKLGLKADLTWKGKPAAMGGWYSALVLHFPYRGETLTSANPKDPVKVASCTAPQPNPAAVVRGCASGTCREGKGVWLHDDDSRVEGTFHEGKLQGPAVMTWTDGNRYEGAFENLFPVGPGTFTRPDGVSYECQLFRWSRSGHTGDRCRYRQGDKLIWEGDVARGSPISNGRYHGPNGDLPGIPALFVDGQLVAPGSLPAPYRGKEPEPPPAVAATGLSPGSSTSTERAPTPSPTPSAPPRDEAYEKQLATMQRAGPRLVASLARNYTQVDRPLCQEINDRRSARFQAGETRYRDLCVALNVIAYSTRPFGLRATRVGGQNLPGDQPEWRESGEDDGLHYVVFGGNAASYDVVITTEGASQPLCVVQMTAASSPIVCK